MVVGFYPAHGQGQDIARMTKYKAHTRTKQMSTVGNVSIVLNGKVSLIAAGMTTRLAMAMLVITRVSRPSTSS